MGHRIPTGLLPGCLHRGSALLVGDAAGVADPFFAEGISYALTSARIAAETVKAYLRGERRDLSAYTGQMRGTMAADMRIWRLTAEVVHRFPGPCVRLLAASPWLQYLVERTVAGEVRQKDNAR